MRRSLAAEMGFVMPSVRILDNVQLDANSYVIKIKEVDSATARSGIGQFMVMDPTGKQVTLPGAHTTEPTFGLPATWIEASLKEEASVKGYTVVDSATVLSTHLTELIKANMAELLSYGEVQKLLKELPKEQAELLKDLVPSLITVSGIQRVLQILLAERVSIRDLSTILEGIADGIGSSRNPVTLAEHVRAGCRARFARSTRARRGYLPLIALSAKWEQAFAELIVGQGDERQSCDSAVEAVGVHHPGAREVRGRGARRRGAGAGDLGRHKAGPLRGIVERFRAQTPVVSGKRNPPAGAVKTVGSI